MATSVTINVRGGERIARKFILFRHEGGTEGNVSVATVALRSYLVMLIDYSLMNFAKHMWYQSAHSVNDTPTPIVHNLVTSLHIMVNCGRPQRLFIKRYASLHVIVTWYGTIARGGGDGDCSRSFVGWRFFSWGWRRDCLRGDDDVAILSESLEYYIFIWGATIESCWNVWQGLIF